MADPAEDSTLKRRARRRLIGAIALVLLAVIVLPMVFDAERKPADADISIQIPNQDAAVAKKGAVTAPGAPADASAQKPASPPLAPDAAPGSAAGKPAPKTDEPAGAKPIAGDAPKSESKAPASVPDDGADKKRAAREAAEEKRAAAILNAEAKESKAAKAEKKAEKTAKDGAFAVQVGAFATLEKVQEARDKLQAANLKTYTEKLDTKDGERTRVRAGPFGSKEAAEAARETIKGLGFASATVVAR